MKQVGDKIYWEYDNGNIDSGIITGISDNKYYIKNSYSVDIDNILLEDDPRVQKCIQEENEGLWIARDRWSGELHIFPRKPIIDERHESWMIIGEENWEYVAEVPTELYPEVTFENSPKKLRI